MKSWPPDDRLLSVSSQEAVLPAAEFWFPEKVASLETVVLKKKTFTASLLAKPTLLNIHLSGDRFNVQQRAGRPQRGVS
jgi:hypothetical protein